MKFPDFFSGVRVPHEAKSSVHMFSACTTMYRPLVSGTEMTIGSCSRSRKPCDHSEFTLIRTTSLKSGFTYVRMRPNWLIGALYSLDVDVAVSPSFVTPIMTSGHR